MTVSLCAAHPQHTIVAVYGTLLSGLPPRHGRPKLRVDEWHKCVTSFVPGTLFDTGRGYPGFVPSGSDRVLVELWCCSPDTLTVLDGWEDFQPNRPEGGEYVRVDVSTLLPFLHSQPVWLYVYNRPTESLARIGTSWRDVHDRAQNSAELFL